MEEDYHHFSEFEGLDSPAEYPGALSHSESGMMEMVEEGHELYKKLKPKKDEQLDDWSRSIRANIPQLEIGQVKATGIKALEDKAGITIPEHVKEFWRTLGSVSIGGDLVMGTLGFIELFHLSEQFTTAIPELNVSRLFIAGIDGHNFAVSLDEHSDVRVFDFEHHGGWTGKSAKDLTHYSAERIAWYCTTFTPFCFDHGFVDPEKYKR